MPVFTLDNELSFPPVHLAEPDGLLAIGGDLSTTRLLTAYRNGIFPWYEDEVPLWWCPDPRFVLFPDKLKINKTTKALLKRNEFEFSINTAFKVIHHCKNVIRPGQEGTWITPEVEKAYCKLYELGHAHSAEVWKNNKLVGGLYGIKMGKVFGESMFSIESNASRFAFTKYVHQLIAEQVELIDCQIYSDYLESMGAEMIPRTAFTQLLQNLLPK
jgi:leucyl/phenylalanyl-tRNA--protein transferase